MRESPDRDTLGLTSRCEDARRLRLQLPAQREAGPDRKPAHSGIP